MTEKRVIEHPIISIPERKRVNFMFKGMKYQCYEGEVITSALIANGIHTFGHHPKDGFPQGIFCANGQCSQCMVIVNGRPVKGCMTKIKPNMDIQPVEGLPELPADDEPVIVSSIREVETQVLILGGGPAGLSAARTLGEKAIKGKIILVDDKDRLGGKLVLQTHKFFGSQEDCYAGTRGIDIAEILSDEMREYSNVDIWLNSTALAVFSDKKIGILKEEKEYVLVKTEKLLVATGAREKNLIFPGNTLPGVYGAGAFQTLVNRDLVKPCERLFIIGGGNVGLIAGYHALQAGINVVGLVEALPKCGGYKVHEDKLRRSGIPIYTSHTVLSANGTNNVESITIARVDEKWTPIKGTEKTFVCDTILIAVGLDPVDEFYHKAKEFNMDTWSAGDAQEIAEASAAMFSGKIEAMKIAKSLGLEVGDVPSDWTELLALLKQPGGEVIQREMKLTTPDKDENVFPVFHCFQKIPCNPCTTVCPIDQIITEDNEIINLPYFKNEEDCRACGRCVAVCPGLAVTLVDYRNDNEMPTVTIPFEYDIKEFKEGEKVTVVDTSSEVIGDFTIKRIRTMKKYPRTQLVDIQVPKNLAKKATGILVQKEFEITRPLEKIEESPLPDEAIVCRCERITAGEIRKWVRKGVKDVNEIKAITRAGMGACGGKTCTNLVLRIFREEGMSLEGVTHGTARPVFVEVPLGVFAGMKSNTEHGAK
ncbi:MAG: FAD-dependent oxidoreductase [Candidatus Hodarchaeales archaeon]|jgi:NADPH-dependent 2,4-dienoyl-CoA reductase/sulfur reductase-like enzyme/Fe-S-cluster-containing hydrogenase component 2/bacterioferritin-associated ferredoxin